MVIVFWFFIAAITLVALLPALLGNRNDCGLPRIVQIIFLILIPALGLGFYWVETNSQTLVRYTLLEEESRLAKKERSKIKEIHQLIAHLKMHLSLYPLDSKGWYALGKLYSVEDKHKKAAEAFEKAYQQQPDDEEYSFSYAKSVFFENNGYLTPSTETLLQKVVEKDPENYSALNLLATNYYLQRQYRFAIMYWERLLHFFSFDHKEKQR